jgi:hypothetical protein
LDDRDSEPMSSFNATMVAASDTYGKTYGSQFLFVLIVIIAYLMLRRWWKKRR